MNSMLRPPVDFYCMSTLGEHRATAGSINVLEDLKSFPSRELFSSVVTHCSLRSSDYCTCICACAVLDHFMIFADIWRTIDDIVYY